MSSGPIGTTSRHCDYPGCEASYDAITGPRGQTAEWHWRQSPTFGLHLCGDHSHLWGAGEGPHAPSLNHETRIGECRCGARFEGPTLGRMSDAYLAHLGEVVRKEIPDA